jgi:hypothetical protein
MAAPVVVTAVPVEVMADMVLAMAEVKVHSRRQLNRRRLRFQRLLLHQHPLQLLPHLLLLIRQVLKLQAAPMRRQMAIAKDASAELPMVNALASKKVTNKVSTVANAKLVIRHTTRALKTDIAKAPSKARAKALMWAIATARTAA